MKPALFLALTLSLASCSGLGALTSLIGGGGPNVAANVQAGKENVQAGQVNQRRIVRPQARSEISESNVRAERVETINEVQPWIIVLLLIGWLAPSPGEIARGVSKFLRRS